MGELLNFIYLLRQSFLTTIDTKCFCTPENFLLNITGAIDGPTVAVFLKILQLVLLVCALRTCSTLSHARRRLRSWNNYGPSWPHSSRSSKGTRGTPRTNASSGHRLHWYAFAYNTVRTSYGAPPQTSPDFPRHTCIGPHQTS